MKFLTGIVYVILLTSSLPLLACTNDMECGSGRVCVKPDQAVGFQGVCATPSDETGNPTYAYQAPSPTPHEVASCQFNTDCDIGYSCLKRSGDLYGVCMK